jgi:perosamine synthetase
MTIPSMIPVNEPRLGENEVRYVMECLQTGWISSEGHFIREFEERWAEYCGMKYAVAVSNGTVALEIAVASLHLQPGDEIILPSFTIISCAQAITKNKGVPVLVDCDAETWCMDISQVESKITSRTRAVMPVHIYGHPVDMDPLYVLAGKHNLTIIEDAAEAHGAEYKGRKCGGLGDVSCFSFYANKIITTGEGGMVLTNDEAQAEYLRSLRNLCFRKEQRFFHTELGNNYRMTNIQAAIGVAQIEQIEKSVQQKRWMANAYSQQLSELEGLSLPVERPWVKNVYWMYGVVLAPFLKLDGREFARRLGEHNVMTRPFFLGMHEQPAFHDMGLFVDEHYPVTEHISRQGLYLPSGLTLTQGQVDHICDAVRKVLRRM